MKTSTRIAYFPLYLLLRGLASLPLPVLYVLSGGLYGLFYHGVRYRRKLVRKNLTDSFPEKSPDEIRAVERGFYRFFCDYIVETVKLLSVSDDWMRRRLRIVNPEAADAYLAEKRVVVLLLGHYGNWEWVPSLTLWMRDGLLASGTRMAQIYRPLKNRWFDAFFLRIRSRFGSYGIPKQDALREMLRLKTGGTGGMVGFMADQTPSRANIHYWVPMLNHDTPVYTGMERIARKIDAAVLYLDIRVTGRGRYEGTYRLISEHPAAEAPFAITDRYVTAFEETIRRDPRYWLWTHNRWKHRRKKEEQA